MVSPTSSDLSPVAPFALSAQLQQCISAYSPYSAWDALEAASALRKTGLEPQQVSFVLNQAKLRTLGEGKFGQRAHHMLLTEAGYEQATRAAVAQLHAQRFKQAGIDSVADLGCGLGADSLGFAAAGLTTVSVEIDPQVAAFTAYNLQEFPSSLVLCANVEELDPLALVDTDSQPVAGLWLDPARREIENGKTNSRHFDPEAFSPPLSFVLQLANSGIPMGVKMGPGIAHEAIPENCEAQWVSHAGSVVELVLWFNALARPGISRSATVLGANPLEAEVLGEITSAHGSLGSPQPEVREYGAYLAEPDGAVVRAHLVSDLAQATGSWLLDERIAYLSADQPIDSALVTNYRIIDELPLNEKVLKRWVREEGITQLTIKKRGVDIVPEQLRSRLLAKVKKKAAAQVPATLLLTRLGEGAASKRIALHIEPL